MSGWYVIPWCWSTNIRDLNSISIRIDGVCVDYQTIKWAPVNLSRKSSVINAMHVVHKHFKGVSKWHQLAVWASEALVLGNYHVASWISMRLWLITGYRYQIQTGFVSDSNVGLWVGWWHCCSDVFLVSGGWF